MIKWLVNRVMNCKAPNKRGPGFFVWSWTWVALSLRYGDELRQDIRSVPITFRFYVAEGEVLFHSWPDMPGGRLIHTYLSQDHEEIAVYVVKAGQWFKVPAGYPALIELNPTRDPVPVSFPWLAEPKMEKRVPAKLLVVRTPY